MPAALCQCDKGDVYLTGHALKHQLPNCGVVVCSPLICPGWTCVHPQGTREAASIPLRPSLPTCVTSRTPYTARVVPHPTLWLLVQHLQMPSRDGGLLSTVCLLCQLGGLTGVPANVGEPWGQACWWYLVAGLQQPMWPRVVRGHTSTEQHVVSAVMQAHRLAAVLSGVPRCVVLRGRCPFVIRGGAGVPCVCTTTPDRRVREPMQHWSYSQWLRPPAWREQGACNPSCSRKLPCRPRPTCGAGAATDTHQVVAPCHCCCWQAAEGRMAPKDTQAGADGCMCVRAMVQHVPAVSCNCWCLVVPWTLAMWCARLWQTTSSGGTSAGGLHTGLAEHCLAVLV